MLKKYISLRWVLLGTAILAILSLTAMNVFSLYKLHHTTIQSDLENKKMQVNDFVDRVEHRFLSPYWGIDKLDIDYVQGEFEQNGQFPSEFLSLIERAGRDSLFTDIYFKPQKSKACRTHASLLHFDRDQKAFVPVSNYSPDVCGGIGTAHARTRSVLDDFHQNNKVIFDANFNGHYSMSIALINLSTQKVFGYLTMMIDYDYMVNHYLQKELIEHFGNSNKSGLIVWVRDWAKDKTIASSAPSLSFDQDNVHYFKRFPNLFDNWSLKVAFTESPTIAASRASLIKNFVVLGVAVALLLGALSFIFVTAQKERALAERQADFLANVTHELKTPLAVMQAAGENLADGRVDKKDRLQSYGQHIHREAIRLKRMIEKMLDVAQADAGQSIIEPQPCDLKELVDSYLTSHRSFIQDQGFTLEISLASGLPLVMIDEDNFNTILSNLVENAIKYSREEKYLAIKLYQKSKKVVLEIIDRGIGIPKKSLQLIFERFYRVEHPLTAQSKGHGLGLSIVKNLVGLNGGEIKAESPKNKGSRFIVEFPILTFSQKGQTSMKTSNNGSKFSKKEDDSPQYVE